MIRKLLFVAALVLTTMATSSTPAPAIDFICTCTVCAGGSGPGCRDLKTGRFTSCSSWWAGHSSQCQ
jgi:hypothetical protein